MKTKNRYDYLLEYSKEETIGLQKFADEITELIEKNQMDEADKAQFFAVIKEKIQRGDLTSYACISLLRDIMTDEMYDFLLEELKKDVFRNVPLSIEIMKIIDVDDFPEYDAFLESVKDEPTISCDLRNFINIVLNFRHGKIGSFGFPTYKKTLGSPGVKDIKDIEFDWTDLADYEFYKSLARRKKILVASITGLLYAIFIVCGLFFLNGFGEFSEDILSLSFAYYLTLILCFCGAKWQKKFIEWKENLIGESIVRHNLSNFIFIIFAIIGFVGAVSSSIMGEGFEYTVCMAIMNASICLYVYLK